MKREIILAQLLAGEWLLLQLKRPVLQSLVTRALSLLIYFPLSAPNIVQLSSSGVPLACTNDANQLARFT